MSLVIKGAPALVLAALLFSPAAAAPVGPHTMDTGPDSLVIQVRDGGHGHGGKGHGGKGHGGKGHHGGGKGHHGGQGHHGKGHGHHGGGRHGHQGGRPHGHRAVHHGGHWRGGAYWAGGTRWVPGGTYYVAPPGWRQYGARPWNWNTLGCVVVNGFWFCP